MHRTQQQTLSYSAVVSTKVFCMQILVKPLSIAAPTLSALSLHGCAMEYLTALTEEMKEDVVGLFSFDILLECVKAASSYNGMSLPYHKMHY